MNGLKILKQRKVAEFRAEWQSAEDPRSRPHREPLPSLPLPRRKISAGPASHSSTRRENSKGGWHTPIHTASRFHPTAWLRLERLNKKKRNADVEV